MSYDDVEIEDMEWNEELQAYTYPCPCGDLFQITKEDLKLGEEIARCPSCSLRYRCLNCRCFETERAVDFWLDSLIMHIHGPFLAGKIEPCGVTSQEFCYLFPVARDSGSGSYVIIMSAHSHSDADFQLQMISGLSFCTITKFSWPVEI
ncbi:hypothetical protein K1719_000617 [Acacia pycnantha]|nr:hypothetical protein K1719_000617 [Acacia pycnantha]